MTAAKGKGGRTKSAKARSAKAESAKTESAKTESAKVKSAKAGSAKAGSAKAASRRPGPKKSRPTKDNPSQTKSTAKQPARVSARRTPTGTRKPSKTSSSKSTKRAGSEAKDPKAASSKANPSKTATAQSNRNAVEAARRSLRSLTATIEQANDRDAEQILGEGRLEALLKAVLPARKRSNKTTYDYLASQKRRASLMARLRHSINVAYSFPVDALGRVLSPTRVQWFYDGLTFIEGTAPFSGVLGLYRNGQLSYGLNVRDASENASLGPAEADFVSVEHAKSSFGAASKPASASEQDVSELMADEAATTERWVALLERYPWMLGAQHSALVRIKQDDSRMPGLFLVRVSDGASDVLLMGQPTTSVFARSGRLQRSFQDTLHYAEQTLSFVGRQADYLEREFDLKISRPRAFLIAGRGLSRPERDNLRHHVETRHADLRVLSLDDLSELAKQTRLFFEERF